MANVFDDIIMPVLDEKMPIWREQANLIPTITRSQTLQNTKYADVPSAAAVETQNDFSGASAAKDWGMSTKRLTINQRCRTPYTLNRIEQAFTEIDLATDFVAPAVKALINKVDASIALNGHLTFLTNRIVTNAPMKAELLTKAKTLIKRRGLDAMAEVLAICPESIETLANDKDLAAWFANTGTAAVMTGAVPKLHGLDRADTSVIYSPNEGRYVNLVYNKQAMRIRFANLMAKTMGEYYGADARQFIDPVSGIALYFIVQKSLDGVTLMLDAAWGVLTCNELLGCAIEVVEA